MMREGPGPKAEAGRVRTGSYASRPGENNGAFLIQVGKVKLTVIASNGAGWDHVSVSTPFRCPTWEEMCAVKDMFFGPEEAVMQLHPPRSEHVNNHQFCLHLWRPHEADIPLPPPLLVGVKSAGTLFAGGRR